MHIQIPRVWLLKQLHWQTQQHHREQYQNVQNAGASARHFHTMALLEMLKGIAIGDLTSNQILEICLMQIIFPNTYNYIESTLFIIVSITEAAGVSQKITLETGTVLVLIQLSLNVSWENHGLTLLAYHHNNLAYNASIVTQSEVEQLLDHSMLFHLYPQLDQSKSFHLVQQQDHGELYTATDQVITYIHPVVETDFRLKKYITTETYIFMCRG